MLVSVKKKIEHIVPMHLYQRIKKIPLYFKTLQKNTKKIITFLAFYFSYVICLQLNKKENICNFLDITGKNKWNKILFLEK